MTQGPRAPFLTHSDPSFPGVCLKRPELRVRPRVRMHFLLLKGHVCRCFCHVLAPDFQSSLLACILRFSSAEYKILCHKNFFKNLQISFTLVPPTLAT